MHLLLMNNLALVVRCQLDLFNLALILRQLVDLNVLNVYLATVDLQSRLVVFLLNIAALCCTHLNLMRRCVLLQRFRLLLRFLLSWWLIALLLKLSMIVQILLVC